MRCHNTNGWAACMWAAGMISVSINWEHIRFLLCTFGCMLTCRSIACGHSCFFTYLQWQVYFYMLVCHLVLGWSSSVCGEGVFLFPEWKRNMEQQHFPLHPTRPGSCRLWKEGKGMRNEHVTTVRQFLPPLGVGVRGMWSEDWWLFIWSMFRWPLF